MNEGRGGFFFGLVNWAFFGKRKNWGKVKLA